MENLLMSESDKQNLSIAFKDYYNFGIEEFQKTKIDNLISKKVNGDLPDLIVWNQMIEKLEVMFSFKLKNEDFWQFPNLIFRIEEETTNLNLSEKKNITFCFSLLCNYYTYFYSFNVSLENKYLISSNIFLFEEKFQDYKISIELQSIIKIIDEYMPNYKYLYHKELMEKNIYIPFPSGREDTYINSPLTIYNYLFDSNFNFTKLIHF